MAPEVEGSRSFANLGPASFAADLGSSNPCQANLHDANVGFATTWPVGPHVEQTWERVAGSIEQLAILDQVSDGPHSAANLATSQATILEAAPRMEVTRPHVMRPSVGSSPEALPSSESERRWEALRSHGDFTLAYNTAVQEGLEYFWSGDSYLAYRCRKGHVFVLGDPVASAEKLPELLREFTAKFPKPTFVQVSNATAAVLERMGYYINEMGFDTVLDLPQYSLAGKSMERIRYAGNWLKKHGYTIAEEDYAAESIQEAMAVSEGWRNGMNCRKAEMKFLNRPICFNDEQGVRKFFLRDPVGKLVAFFYFDPLYRDGKVIGYATAIKRRLSEAPVYAEQGIMRAAVETFKSEGLERVTLGLSPMAGIENKTFRCNPFLHYSFRYAFRAWWVNRYFYNLEGHAQYKRHFKGREVQYHYASPVLFNDLRIYHLMRLTGVC